MSPHRTSFPAARAILIGLAAFALLAVVPVASAQQLAVASYFSEDGLAHPQVWSIYQDSRGYVWIGTTEGVNRYDGVSFLTLSARDGLRNQTVRTIIEDGEGRLWFGTDNGIAVFDGRTIVSQEGQPGAPEGTIWGAAKDSSGRIWFATHYNGVVLRTNEGFRSFGIEDGIASEYVYGVFIDSKNQLWLGHRGEGVTRCSIAETGPTDCQNWGVDDGIANGEVHAITEGPDGSIYIGTRGGGVVRFDGETFQLFDESYGFGENDVYTLMINDRGDLVIGTVDRGISICTLPAFGECKTFGMSNGLADDGVLAVTQDRDGTVWIGFENGLSRIMSERLVSYTIRDGLPHHTVYALAPEANGAMWVGTLGGLAHIDAKDHRRQKIKAWEGTATLPGDEVWDLLLDSRGRLWVTTEAGLCHFEEEGGCVEVYKAKDGLASDDLLALGETARGDLLVTSIEGLSILSFPRGGGPPTIRNYGVDDGLAGSIPYGVVEDSEERIWLGTDQGLSVIDHGEIRSYSVDEGLPVDEVFSMAVDPGGTIWLGTNGGGLVAFDPPPKGEPPVFRVYGELDSVPDAVAAIFPRPDGGLWIGTNDGVFRFDPDSGEQAILVFDKDSGLVGNEVNIFALDTMGRLWIGAVGGATRFDPRIEESPVSVPKITIERVSTFRGDEWRAPFSEKSSREGESKWLDGSVVSLPHDRNSVRIEFRGLSFRERGHLRYEYQLVGFDASWVNTTENFKEYTNLDPGHYTFRIRSATRGSGWSPPREVRIDIRPAWWQTMWFYLFMVAFILATLTIGYRARTYAINARNRELELAVAERTDDLRRYARSLEEYSRALDRANARIREADRVKSEFLANMSHELRTPLNSIIGFSDVLVPRLDGKIEGREHQFLRNVQSSGRYLLLLINNLLDLSKIEAGRMDLYLESMEVEALIENTCSVVQGYASEKNVNVQYEVDPNLGEVRADIPKVRQILLNLLSNAVKFSRSGSTVKVHAAPGRLEDLDPHVPCWQLSVKDQGPGIRPEDVDLIFEEFRQVGGGSTHPGGTGLGLALVRRFVRLMGGRIEVDSEPESGSTFRVFLPVEVTQSPWVEAEGAPERSDAVQPRILLIEDREGSLEPFATILEREGFLPVRARDSKEALRMAREISPAVLILEIPIPDLKRWSLFGDLGNWADSVEVPVIVCIRDEGRLVFGLGADGWILKPMVSGAFHSVARVLAGSQRDGARRVLIASSDDASIESMTSTLQGMEIDWRLAASCAELMVEATAERPTFVVVDLLLEPDGAGFEAAHRLQHDRRTKDIPVLLVASRDLSLRERQSFGTALAREVPISFEELPLLIHELIRRRSARAVRLAAATLPRRSR